MPHVYPLKRGAPRNYRLTTSGMHYPVPIDPLDRVLELAFCIGASVVADSAGFHVFLDGRLLAERQDVVSLMVDMESMSDGWAVSPEVVA